MLQPLSTDAASRFLHHWRENNCALSELRRMERRVRAIDAREFDIALVSYTGYVNLIYGSRFKKISLFGLARCQTTLHLYISASKAGGQYLDSLGGEAEVSSEGSYKKNTFLLDRSNGLPERTGETMCA